MGLQSRLLGVAGAALLVTSPASAPVEAQPSPEVAVVLLTDVSDSIDGQEYEMVKAGYEAAFSDPDVIAAVSASPGGVAVAYVEFSDADQVILVEGWRLLTDAASSRAFGEAVGLAPRSSAGNTALAASLRQSAQLLLDSDFANAQRLVIDIASDHPSDGGRAAAVRDRVVEVGITINALPINDHRQVGTFNGTLSYGPQHWGWGGMTEFYRRDIIGGVGSFLVEAADYSAFGEAFKRKLLLELLISQAALER